MARLPVGRQYNEFDDDQRAAIEQLGLRSAQEHKRYLDKELEPFRKGRTIILVGEAGAFSGGSISVSVAVPTVDENGEPSGSSHVNYRAQGISQDQARRVSGHTVRILLDTRTSQVYYDDRVY